MSVGFGGVTVREALDSAVIAIGAAGSDTPRLDAELLLADVLRLDRTALFAEPGREVAGPAVRGFQDAVRRRSVLREPVAYILGSKGFRHIELLVDPRVLVPRPETELLVDVGLGLARGARVVDVGTGSGAIALALKQERPDLSLTATDSSAGALEVARANAAALGLEVTLTEGDLLAGVRECDAVLSNPPYVADGERASLAPEIVRHEPAGALFAGADGLDVIRRLAPAAAAVLVPGGLLAIEHGAGQAAAVAALFEDAGFEGVHALPDLAGIERVTTGHRS
ncbi:MAG TPA: peptide chain release factor N(5)-glutamine methyltransferase [Solirubrobacteraceae bacterium]